MADNKVNFLRGTSAEYEASAKDNDIFYYTTDDKKLYLGENEITGGGVTVDDSLSDTSKNPVQNKVVKMALDGKADLSDIPTSLPANGGNADTANISYHQHLRILTDGEDILAYATSDECNAGDIVRVKDSPSCPINFGYDASYNDFFYQIFKIDNSWVTVKAFDVRSNAEFVNSYCGSEWIGWSRCNDGGNADTVDGLHANEIASNPNLTVNPDFKVNQKGLTSFSGNGYTVDHWRMYKHSSTSTYGTVSVIDNGIHVASGGTKLDTHIQQYIENWKSLEGKTVTLSFEIDNLVGSLSVCQMGNTVFNITTNGVHTKTFNWKSGQSNNSILFYNGLVAQISYDLKWVKLELGSIATPFVPPDFATELLRIQAMDGTISSDTVDGKHASDFMQNLGYLTTGSLLDYVLTLTSSGSFFISSNVTDTPISGLFYGVDVIRHTGGDFVITATRFNGGGVWTNRYNSGAKKWYGWANVADGGNADTLDGLHETSFSRERGDISDCNNAVLTGTYNAIPATINTPYSAYWLVTVETGANGVWIRQTATACDSSKPNETYRRLFINDKWSDSWAKVNDGGNAVTANTAGSLSATSSNVCLRNLSSGTAEKNTTNCPSGAWYGRHD